MSALFDKRWGDVLGMNARYLGYVSKYNTGDAVRVANNKLATKRALQKAGLATPRLFGVIHNRKELKKYRWTKLPSSFVLKPNTSLGGGGIVVIFGRNKKGNWVKADKTEVFIPELKNHVIDILDGNFSKGNVPDSAFFEQRIKVHSSLKAYSVKGIPDIRIIVFNGVPAMAMLRLPTEQSHGKANLHAGGIGAGIDMSLGMTTTAVQHGTLIDTLPGKRLGLAGIPIPHWDDILLLSVRAAEAVGLKYAGVDIAVDRDDGPVVLETNAHPGLEIQFANLAPLKSRLEQAAALTTKSIEKKIRLGKNLFGADAEQTIEDMSGKGVLGIEEEVSLLLDDSEEYPVIAKIDTGAYRTTIDETLARKLHLHQPVIDKKRVRGALGMQHRPIVEIKMKLRNRIITTHASLTDRSYMNYDIIIGRRDMAGFLVDPAKRYKKARA